MVETYYSAVVGTHSRDCAKCRNLPSYPKLISWFLRGAGIFHIGKPATGKSTKAKHLILLLQRVRPQWVFDFKGELTRDLLTPRSDAEYPDWLTDVQIFEDFTFYLSQFDQQGDWIALGFENMQAALIVILIREAKHKYEDDVLKFREMLKEIPIKKKGGEVTRFNEKYGTSIDGPMNFAAWESMINRFRHIAPCFHQGQNDKRPVHDFWAEFQKSRNNIVNLHIRGRHTNKKWAMARAGKIFSQLEGGRGRDNLYIKFHPLISVEEAKQLFPNFDSENKPTSLVWGIEFMTQRRKEGVALQIIMQTLSQIHPDMIAGGNYSKFVFKLSPDLQFSDDLKKISSSLRSDLREACWVDEGDFAHYFIPDLPGCAYETDL